MTIEIAKNSDYKDFKRLFFSAFPPEERPPYFFMKRKLKQGKGELLIAKNSDDFVGFIYLISYQDMVYIFFFAVDEKLRGRGLGSEILQFVIKRYQGKRIFLAREPLDDNADNAEQRRKRRDFYLKNGFDDLPIKIIENNYVFDAMGIGGNISAQDYDVLITNWSGRIVRKIVGMRVEE